MKTYLKKHSLGLILSFVCCLGISVAYICAYDISDMELVDKYRILCDAFSLPGMLMILFGGLMWCSSKGTLDFLGFSLQWLVKSIIPGKRLEKDERYGDYVVRQREKRKGGYSCMFVAGIFFLLTSFVFYLLFNSVS